MKPSTLAELRQAVEADKDGHWNAPGVLEAAERIAGARVKLLPWQQNWANDPNSQWALVEDTNRSYTIDPESNVFRLSTEVFPRAYDSATDMGLFPTLEAAKAAAQADYERRIISALAGAEP